MALLSSMSFGRITDPDKGRPGQLRGSYDRYRWELTFNAESVDATYYRWRYHFTVRLGGSILYRASADWGPVSKDLLGDRYLRQLCNELMQTYLAEGALE